MRSKLASCFPAAGLMLALPLWVAAEPGHLPCGAPPLPPHQIGAPAHGMAPPPFLHGVALSEAQQDAVFKIVHAAAPTMRQHDKAFQQAREKLRALSNASASDEPGVIAAVDQLAKAMMEMELLRFRTDQKIRALLTPEQLQKLRETGPGEVIRR